MIISILAHRNAAQCKCIFQTYFETYSEDLLKSLESSSERQRSQQRGRDGAVRRWERAIARSGEEKGVQRSSSARGRDQVREMCATAVGWQGGEINREKKAQ